MSKKAIVIGAGLAGLATAIRLKLRGFDVTIYESNAYTGGKATEFHRDGFRFDAGPSLFTMPELVDDLFRLAGKNPSDYIETEQLPVTCNYFFPDGTTLTAWSDPDKFAKEIEEKTTDSAESVHKFLTKAGRIFELTSELFMKRSLHRLSTYTNKTAWNALIHLPEIDTARTMITAIRASFKDPKTIQLFSRYATYNGSNPYQAPATLNIIPHLEHSRGAFFPKNGMIGISSALTKLAEETGVKIELNSKVERIIAENGTVKSVLVKGNYAEADIIVSNMDIHYTYHNLLPDQIWPERTLNQPKSSSALIFYWAMNKSFPKLDLHNILFSPDYQKEFEFLFDRFEVFDQPTVYVYISSKRNREDAPAGKENWFVMINVPHNRGQDWDKLVHHARKSILSILELNLGEPIEPQVLSETVLDPRGIESRTSSYMGALYGNSSNNRFAAFMRHPNFSKDTKGLYFCGGSVHPGGGIPLVLLSAKIVDDLVREDHDLP